MARQRLVFRLFGYAILLYIWFLLPFNLYEPTPTFHLPTILWFIHLIILYIHEAGHFFFRMFGETMYILGGSIMQVLVPFVWFIGRMAGGICKCAGCGVFHRRKPGRCQHLCP